MNMKFDAQIAEIETGAVSAQTDPVVLLDTLPLSNKERDLLVLGLVMMDITAGLAAQRDEMMADTLAKSVRHAGLLPDVLKQDFEGDHFGVDVAELAGCEDNDASDDEPRGQQRNSGQDFNGPEYWERVDRPSRSWAGAVLHSRRRSPSATPAGDNTADMHRSDTLEHLEALALEADCPLVLQTMFDHDGTDMDSLIGQHCTVSQSDIAGDKSQSDMLHARLHHQRHSIRSNSLAARQSRADSKSGASTRLSRSFSMAEYSEDAALRPRRMGMASALFSLVNDVATSGIVSVPYFVIVMGLPVGLLALVFLAVLAHATLLLLHRLTLERNLTSLADTCYVALGRPGYLMATTAVFMFNFGGFVGGLMMVAEMIPDIFTYILGPQSYVTRTSVLIVSLLLVTPMALKRHLASLSILSAFSVVVMIVLTIGVTVQSLVYMRGGSPEATPQEAQSATTMPNLAGIVQGLGGIGYLFACHDLAFHISTALEKNTMRRYAIVSGLAIYVPMALLGAMSCVVFGTFGTATPANVIDSFYESDPMAFVLRLLLSANVVCNIPYTMYMPRIALLSLVQLKYPHLVLPGGTHAAQRTAVHCALTLLLLLAGFWVANTVTDLGTVFGLVGGLSGIAISTVLPALCYIRLGGVNRPRHWLLTCALWALLLVGLVIMTATCAAATQWG